MHLQNPRPSCLSNELPLVVGGPVDGLGGGGVEVGIGGIGLGIAALDDVAVVAVLVVPLLVAEADESLGLGVDNLDLEAASLPLTEMWVH